MHIFVYCGQYLKNCWSLYPPYECTYMYGGYYGLVVFTPRLPPPPRPQTFHRSHDNLKNPYRIASIFDMWIDIDERIAGKQDGPGPIIYGPPRAPWIAKNAIVLYIVAHIWKTGSYLSPLLYIHVCLLCDKVLLPCNFRSPGFDKRAPRTPQIWTKVYFFICWV